VIPLAGWVAPFGDPGITDRSHLPRAFRSVPRPSSPLSAKASTRCPYLRLIPGGTPKANPWVPPHNTAAHRGKTPYAQAASHEDTSRIHSSLAARAYPPRSHDKLSLHPSNNTPPGSPRTVSLSLLQTPDWCPDGGGERIRTDDLLLAKQALSQLSYTPGQRSENRGQRSDLCSDLRSLTSDTGGPGRI
jgi:hypothetical protein